MTRVTLAFHFLSLFLVLAVLPRGGSAGPACAQKYWNTVDCLTKCQGKWGYPGRKMGSDRWGSVMKESAEIWGAVAANACGSESSDTTNGKGVVGGVENGPPTSLAPSTSAPATTSTASSSSSSKASSATSSTSSKTKSSTTTTATPTTTSQRQQEAEPTTTQEKQAPTTQDKPQETPKEKEPDNGDNGGGSSGSGGNSGGNSGGTSGGDIGAYLKGHNDARAQHGASPLSWSDNLASAAQKWANNCDFQHSGGAVGAFGENLAAGSGDSYGISDAIKSWTDESKDYNPSNPQSSHFTQVVWKGTSQVGCALQLCDGIFDASFGKARYYVCEYSNPGNVKGKFAQNVQA